MFRLIPASFLANDLARNLFFEEQLINYVCESTGTTIKACTNPSFVSTLDKQATGSYYEAFGYYYLLCFDEHAYDEFLAIYEVETKNLVGYMENPEEVKVTVHGAKVKS